MIKSLVSNKVERLEKEMQELAGQAIKLIEGKFAELGIKALVGIEAEGWAEKKPEHFDDPTSPLDENSISDEFNGRVVEKFYEEDGGGRKYKKYEFVTSALPPRTAALATIKLKDIAAVKAKDYGLSAFTFDPFKHGIPYDVQTAGMHVNISLSDEYGNPLFKFIQDGEDYIPNKIMLHATNTEALLVQQDSLFCIAMGKDNYRRFDDGQRFAPSYISSAVQDVSIDQGSLILRHSTKEYEGYEFLPPEQFRIENRLPGADTNPYLAVLTTMALVYAGIKENVGLDKGGNLKIKEKTADIPAVMSPPTEPAYALSDFVKQGNKFVALLNGLSEGLGTDFVNKVLEYAEARYHLVAVGREATGVTR